MLEHFNHVASGIVSANHRATGGALLTESHLRVFEIAAVFSSCLGTALVPVFFSWVCSFSRRRSQRRFLRSRETSSTRMGVLLETQKSALSSEGDKSRQSSAPRTLTAITRPRCPEASIT